jgi:hypothetical protein
VEFVAGDLETARACVERLRALGAYRFNVILGEGRDFLFGAWRTADEALRWLREGADGAPSGDIYARLEGARDRRPATTASAPRSPHGA